MTDKVKNDPQKDLQNKYSEYQVISQQLKQMQQQMQTIDAQVNEVNFIIDSLGEFENTKVGDEILVPLSNGIFAKAELKDNKKLLMNVGNSTIVEKTVPEASELLKSQLAEIQKYRDQVEAALGQLTEQAMFIEKDLKNLQV